MGRRLFGACRWLWPWRAFLLLAGLCYAGTAAGPGPAAAVLPAMRAPEVSLADVRGGAFRLADFADQMVLLSFLSTQPEADGAGAATSRSQAVFLQSMARQYGARGVQIAIVDASLLQTGRRPAAQALLNAAYDWNLGDIPLLADDEAGSTARRYGVRRAPTTFLIGPGGVVARRWEGFATAPQMAFSLQALLGES